MQHFLVNIFAFLKNNCESSKKFRIGCSLRQSGLNRPSLAADFHTRLAAQPQLGCLVPSHPLSMHRRGRGGKTASHPLFPPSVRLLSPLGKWVSQLKICVLQKKAWLPFFLNFFPQYYVFKKWQCFYRYEIICWDISMITIGKLSQE